MNPTEKLLQISKDFDLFEVSQAVLGDTRFPIWSGSGRPEQHHYGKGGLAQHTLEVVELCLRNNEYFDRPVDSRSLFLAALFHDAGKMWDYEPFDDGHTAFDYNNWRGTDHKKKIYHISRSALVWHEAYFRCLPGKIDEDEVLHAILAHHQLREWGSPVNPHTKMAWILHLSDGMSARVNDAGKWDGKK